MEMRIKRLNEVMRESGTDGVLITDTINCRYFSGFTGTNGTLLIARGRNLLFTDFRYTIQAKQQTRGLFEIVEVPQANALSTLEGAIRDMGLTRLGFEDETLTVARFRQWEDFRCEWVPFSEKIARLRCVKSPDEIDCIRRAQKVSERAFSELLERIHPGMTEKEAANELLYLMRKHGAEGPSFAPIVASGPNGALCHAVPTDRAFEKGDLVVMDFGSIVDGYCSDMTRTVAIGQPSAHMREIYDIVLEANLRTLAALRPGMAGKALDHVARDYIAAHGYAEAFGHGLGHGFGLEIHEAPYANKTWEGTLEPFMTITVEPGIYIEGEGGVRIEDCCVLTEDGYENFAAASKELVLI